MGQVAIGVIVDNPWPTTFGCHHVSMGRKIWWNRMRASVNSPNVCVGSSKFRIHIRFSSRPGHEIRAVEHPDTTLPVSAEAVIWTIWSWTRMSDPIVGCSRYPQVAVFIVHKRCTKAEAYRAGNVGYNPTCCKLTNSDIAMPFVFRIPRLSMTPRSPSPFAHVERASTHTLHQIHLLVLRPPERRRLAHWSVITSFDSEVWLPRRCSRPN